VFGFPFANQIFHCAGHIFDRTLGVNPMLIKKIDGFDLESSERPRRPA